ncbi:MAG: hypothetical protein U5L45_04850 [Saprospiraceae bacterium]|nr:hypothetical protein [Saprospiraceae bacterium]
MATHYKFLRLPILLFLVVFFAFLSPVVAQNEAANTEESTDTQVKNKRKDVSSAEKNANDLRKINLLLAIAQDRDRQAGETVEEMRSRRMRMEEDLTELEDNPQKLSKKEKRYLEAQVKSLEKKENSAQKTRETANKFLLEVTQAMAAEPSKRAKFLGGYERKFGPITDAKPIKETNLETYKASEKDKSKAVAVSEKNNTEGTPPSVSTPVMDDNSGEKTSEPTVSTSVKKKQSKVKQNEKAKKVAEKTTKKKKTRPTKEVKNDDTFPVALNEPTPVFPSETVEPVVEKANERAKIEKKEPKKTTKKKGKKQATAANKLPQTEDFPLVFAENTPTTPVSNNEESIADNDKTTESSQETASANEVKNNDKIDETIGDTPEENERKTTKKTKKSDKKTKKKEAIKKSQGSLVSYRTYDRSADVFMKSPPPECAIAYDGRDEFTGKNKRETVPTQLFAHTDEAMRKGLQDKEFITCDLTGTKVESSRYTYLNMTFTILSKDIQRTLGFLDRGTPIIFVLVNGKKITMRTNKTDIGVVDIDKNTTTYKAQLTAESITDLTESELDYVRVNWSSGYEDYEVYDVDVLKNLFNCLYKK